MLKSHAEIEEIEYDMQQGRWTPEQSLFAEAEHVPDDEPEVLKKPGKWVKRGGGFEVYVEDK